MAAIAARGTPAGNKFLPPEGHATVAAVSGFDPNFCFVYEHSFSDQGIENIG
jgi:hypothetical protein